MILRLYLTPCIAKTKTIQITAHADKDVQQGEHLFIAGGRANFYKYFGIKKS